MAYSIPFVDPKKHYYSLKSEIDAAITDCLSKGDLIYRQQLCELENHLASFVGVKYAVGVSSGYHALHFSLLAAGIGPGDEVITVGHTFVATVSAIVHCGAKPVLVEVRDDFNMDPDQVEHTITPRTKALLPVHLNGRVCEMGRIMEIADRHGLVVIEDAAQSLGAKYTGRKAGSIGTTGCFSFYPFKVLGGFGDGGAVTTNDAAVARMVSLLRYNGEDRETGEYHYHGYTALLDNVQAAVLDVKLRHLPQWIDDRRKIAALYHRGLEGIPGLKMPPFDGDGHFDVFQNYVICTSERDSLREHLKKYGVETLISWPKPMWHHKGLALADPNLPRTERLCREVVSLPMSAETTPEQVEITVRAIREFFSHRDSPTHVHGRALRGRPTVGFESEVHRSPCLHKHAALTDMEPDYSMVTELPGSRVSREQLSRLYHRYRTASPYCEGKDVLEVGCGAGLGLGYLARSARVMIGGDCNATNLSHARQHHNSTVHLVRFDAHRLPFANGKFDVVILFEALYYLASPGEFLAESRRVLRKNGALLICTVNKEWPDFNPSPLSVGYFSGPELARSLREKHFEVELFGAYLAQNASVRDRVISAVKRAAIALDLMPKTMREKEFLKRIFFGELTTLPPEIGERDMAYAAPTPISCEIPVSQYKILYAIAHAR